MASKLKQLRQEWADYLEALPYFDDITILQEDKGDIKNEFDRAIGVTKTKGAKCGLVIVLMTVSANFAETGEFGPLMDPVLLMAAVFEDPTINRGAAGTGKTYEEVVEQIAGYTNGVFRPLSGNGFFVSTKDGIQTFADPNYAAKTCSFSCSASLNIALQQNATPVIAFVGGNVSISCATPGAAIFYTVDGRKPNPFHTLYTGQFAKPAAGTTIKARAWLSGRLASEISTIVT